MYCNVGLVVKLLLRCVNYFCMVSVQWRAEGLGCPGQQGSWMPRANKKILL